MQQRGGMQAKSMKECLMIMNMCGFSANIITRLKKDEYISLESVEKICRTLDCGVDDILNFIPEEKEQRNDG